jgi:hypothetical protein
MWSDFCLPQRGTASFNLVHFCALRAQKQGLGTRSSAHTPKVACPILADTLYCPGCDADIGVPRPAAQDLRNGR